MVSWASLIIEAGGIPHPVSVSDGATAPATEGPRGHLALSCLDGRIRGVRSPNYRDVPSAPEADYRAACGGPPSPGGLSEWRAAEGVSPAPLVVGAGG